MGIFRGWSLIFGIAGVLLAALVIASCVFGRNAEPGMLFPTDGAARCADGMLARICAGDYAGASAYCSGNPVLDPDPRTETEKQIWEAFTGSLAYTLVGDCYATPTGEAQDVMFTSLQIPSVTRKLRQRALALLESRIVGARTMWEVYDEDLSYREDFVMDVLKEAVAQAIAEDGCRVQQKLTLHMTCDRGRWQVQPDATLLNAICGGILG